MANCDYCGEPIDDLLVVEIEHPERSSFSHTDVAGNEVQNLVIDVDRLSERAK